MICRKCNATVPANTTFCSHCGASSQERSSLSGGYGKLGSSRSSRSAAVGLPIGLIVSWILLICGFVFVVPSCLETRSYDMGGMAVWLLLGCIAAIISGLVGIRSACPNCHKLFTAQTINSQHLGTHTEIERERRTAKHTDFFGKPTGQTHYDVDVPITVTSYVETYQCVRCNHVWSKQKQNRA